MSSGEPLTVGEPAAELHRLRHDLLTAVNHALGFSELLQDELENATLQLLLQRITDAARGLEPRVREVFGETMPAPDTPALLRLIDTGTEAMALASQLFEDRELPPGSRRDVERVVGGFRTLLRLLGADPDEPNPVAPNPKRSTPPAGKRQGDAGRILAVDDVAENRDILARRLERLGHAVALAEDGYQALELLEREAFDLVLLDVMMPGIDGSEVLRRIKAADHTRDLPVIMISALTEMDSIVRCIQLGAEDYLPKPFNRTLLQARIDACLEKKRLRDVEREHRLTIERYNAELEDRVALQVRDITLTQHSTIFALSKLAESRDPETGAHLERLCEFSKLLAEQLRATDQYTDIIDDDFIDHLYTASPLHDVGKVGVPDEVLRKPGRLTAEEFEVMKSHARLGADTLRAVERRHPGNGFVRIGIEVAERHHERWDGSGYPDGISGHDIPLSARILALADVYDALRTERCYKPAFTHETAREEIVSLRGKSFDPAVVDAFLEREQEFAEVWERLSQS